MATEAQPDGEALRFGRRARLYAAMAAHDLDVLVLGRVANIRYAAGVPMLWNAGTRPFGPGCVVVREADEIHLMSTWDEGVPDEIPHENLYGITWNPMNMVATMQAIAAEHQPRRVGTDAISPLFAQLLPMAFGEADIVDAGAALSAARRVKIPEEVDAIRAALAVAEAGVAAAEEVAVPGVSEHELSAVFMDAMATRGVTTPSRQDVVRITTGRDTHDGIVQEGDLVSFRGGVVADGYVGEVGRTRCVGEPTAAIAALQQRNETLRAALVAACRPGASGTDLLDAYTARGEPLPSTPIAHGLGLGFDDPVIARDLPATAAEQEMESGLVLALTATVTDDAVGSVSADDAVLVTADGAELLTASPIPTIH